MLLHSPKSGTVIHPKPAILVVLSLVFGLILGGMWNKLDARTDPCTQLNRFDDYILRNQHANESHSLLGGNTSTRGDFQFRKPNSNATLSIAWLMSFPVNYSGSLHNCRYQKSAQSFCCDSRYTCRTRAPPTQAFSSGRSRGRILRATTDVRTWEETERAFQYSRRVLVVHFGVTQ